MKRRTHDQAPALTGSLLAALPSLLDPHFRRTVLFLSHHEPDEGALGFILNRPQGALCSELTGLPRTLDGLPLFEGGPVGRGDLIVASLEWTDAGAAFESIRDPDPEGISNTPLPKHFRAFEGYAGWSAGQLEGEIREGSWAVLAPARDLLMDVTTPDEGLSLWKRVMKRVGPWEGLLAEAPDDPTRN